MELESSGRNSCEDAKESSVHVRRYLTYLLAQEILTLTRMCFAQFAPLPLKHYTRRYTV